MIEPFYGARWLPFRNDSGEKIPPYSVVRITGIFDNKGQLNYKADKPNDERKQIYAVTGNYAVAPKGYGDLTFDGPCLVAYKEADGKPVLLEKWGTVEDEWHVRSREEGGRGEFVIAGQVSGQKGTVFAFPIWCV